MTQPHITMWSYVWDLVDDGIDEVLQRMRDEVGLNALSLATHYHSVEHFRPHSRGPFIYRSDSALYFKPDLKLYAGDLRQKVAPLARRGNPLRRISDRAHDLGMQVVSWTICCHATSLGRQRPDCCQHNALGDVYPEALCPANPNVRGFVVGLAADLSHNYGIDLIELESCHYAGGRHYHWHDKIGVELSSADTLLLCLCFCAHCRARGRARGVDVDALQTAVAQRLRLRFDSPQPGGEGIPALLDHLPGLREFLAMRIEVVESLHRDLRAASASPISPIAGHSPEHCGMDLGNLGRLAEHITACAYTNDRQVVRRVIRDVAGHLGGTGKIRFGFQCYPPAVANAAELVAVVETALDEGVSGFTFYNYGIAPSPCLGWVREASQAIRRRLGS